MFGIEGPLDSAMRRWTELLYRDFAAVHHWDLPAGPAVYRVFLLPGLLEVDIGFTPAAEFGPDGPSWRTVFGHPVQAREGPSPGRQTLAGLGWHHALHAWVSMTAPLTAALVRALDEAELTRALGPRRPR